MRSAPQPLKSVTIDRNRQPPSARTHYEWIEAQVALGRNAVSIYHDLVAFSARDVGVNDSDHRDDAARWPDGGSIRHSATA